MIKKYEREVCAYVYVPELGDPDGGIAPGIAWKDFLEDGVCPLCAVGKEQFRKVE